MIVEIFIAMLIMAFILTILGVETDGIAYLGLGLVMWIVLFVQSLWIDVPYVIAYVTGGTVNITATSDVYTEFGLSAISLGFVFVHVLWLVLVFVEPEEPGYSLWDSLLRKR